MTGSEESLGFVEYLLGADFRFLQERDVGLDLYQSGIWGISTFSLLVASVTIFLLAIFHLLPSRRHIVVLLLGLGVAGTLLGSLGAYLRFAALPDAAQAVARSASGPPPVTRGQEAVVIALPLLVGLLTLAFNALGCLYLGVFWGSSLLEKRKNGTNRKARKGQKERPTRRRSGA